jgi:hypothetical protein
MQKEAATSALQEWLRARGLDRHAPALTANGVDTLKDLMDQQLTTDSFLMDEVKLTLFVCMHK